MNEEQKRQAKLEYDRRYYHLYKVNGLCTGCRQVRVEKRELCSSCREKKNAVQRRHLQDLKERGICIMCRRNPVEGGYVHCPSCRTRRRFFPSRLARLAHVPLRLACNSAD